MSIKVITWVWESSRSSGIDRLVLLAIADAASGDDGTNAYPSVATLARKAAVSTRTVQRAIRALCELGELEMDQGAGRKGANMYRVVMRQVDTPPAQMTPVTVTPPLSTSTRTPVTLSPPPRPDDTRSVLEPLEPGEEPSPFCTRHPNGTSSPCTPCGRAAMVNAAWWKSKRRRDAARRKAQQDAAINADLAAPLDQQAMRAARQNFESGRRPIGATA